MESLISFERIQMRDAINDENYYFIIRSKHANSNHRHRMCSRELTANLAGKFRFCTQKIESNFECIQHGTLVAASSLTFYSEFKLKQNSSVKLGVRVMEPRHSQKKKRK